MNSLVKFNSIGTEIDRVFDSLFNEVWGSPEFMFSRNWRPTDTREDDKNYYLEVELAGFKKSEVKAEVIGNKVQISAKNGRGEYERTFVCSNADVEKIESKLEDGILYVTVPKKNPDSSKKLIEIK